MPRITFKLSTPVVAKDFKAFLGFLRRYLRYRGYQAFARFEFGKGALVDMLYKQRGRYARPFLHFGTIGLVFLVITLGPLLLSEAEEQGEQRAGREVITPSTVYATGFTTAEADSVKQFRGGETITHIVQDGETLSSIAARYNLDVSTIIWENSIDEKTKLKPGQELRILPIDGVRHKVARGETIASIGKKYGLEDDAELQKIVSYPFNEFLNDETFELATGQFILIPDGVKPNDPAPVPTTRRNVARSLTPDAGAVSGTGSFVWPAAGKITQRFLVYHRGIDIANRGGGPILAADAGTVREAGWVTSGYGNHVVIDHGNGYVTLYAHLSVIQVRSGQRVNRGDVLGQMGTTGRSTGVHLHFEVRQGGSMLNPLNFLR